MAAKKPIGWDKEYLALRRDAKKKGTTEREAKAINAILERRNRQLGEGISEADAKRILRERTAAGKAVAGMKGGRTAEGKAVGLTGGFDPAKADKARKRSKDKLDVPRASRPKKPPKKGPTKPTGGKGRNSNAGATPQRV